MVVTIWFLFKIHGPPLYVYRPMGQFLSESLFLEKKKELRTEVNPTRIFIVPIVRNSRHVESNGSGPWKTNQTKSSTTAMHFLTAAGPHVRFKELMFLRHTHTHIYVYIIFFLMPPESFSINYGLPESKHLLYQLIIIKNTLK